MRIVLKDQRGGIAFILLVILAVVLTVTPIALHFTQQKHNELGFSVEGEFPPEREIVPGEAFASTMIAIMRHDARRFVEKVDFITTPGYLPGPGSREAAGLPPGTGPYRVVTNLAVLGYHPESKRMMLLETQPGVTVDQVVENTGFELIIPEHVGKNPPPTVKELRILRDEVDKNRLYI